MRLIWHYSFAFMGGFLAMSAHVYWLFGRGAWLAPQRLDSTLSTALIFAHLLALTVVVARDISVKSVLAKLIISLTAGTLLGTVTWFAHIFLFLYQTSPNPLTLLLGGFAFAIGYTISGLPIKYQRVRAIISMGVSACAIYSVIFMSYQQYLTDSSAQALLYFQPDNPNDVYLIGVPFALTLAIIPNIPMLFTTQTTSGHSHG